MLSLLLNFSRDWQRSTESEPALQPSTFSAVEVRFRKTHREECISEAHHHFRSERCSFEHPERRSHTFSNWPYPYPYVRNVAHGMATKRSGNESTIIRTYSYSRWLRQEATLPFEKRRCTFEPRDHRYGNATHSCARSNCQRTNCRWDSRSTNAIHQ
jgi:hypothetical protein